MVSTLMFHLRNGRSSSMFVATTSLKHWHYSSRSRSSSEPVDLAARDSRTTLLGKRSRDDSDEETHEDVEDAHSGNEEMHRYDPAKIYSERVLDSNGEPVLNEDGEERLLWYNEVGVELDIIKVAIPKTLENVWKKWTERASDGRWCCTYPVMKDGRKSKCAEAPCGLKRHIEASHMGIKSVPYFDCGTSVIDLAS